MSKTSANPGASPTSPARRKSPEEIIKQKKNISNVAKYSSKDLANREVENSENLEQLFGNGNQIAKDIVSLKRKNKKKLQKSALDSFIDKNRNSVDDKNSIKSRKSIAGSTVSDTLSLLNKEKKELETQNIVPTNNYDKNIYSLRKAHRQDSQYIISIG